MIVDSLAMLAAAPPRRCEPVTAACGAGSAATLLDALRRNLHEQPDELAFRFAGGDSQEPQSLTHLELGQRVARFAHALREIGAADATPQHKVVLVLPQGPDFVAAFFACIAAGAIAVPTFPPKNPLQAERLTHVLEDLRECTVVAEAAGLDTELAGLRRHPALDRIRWLSVEDMHGERRGGLDGFEVDADAIAMLQYTSGSTGRPKGVIVSQRNLVENSRVIQEAFGHRRGVSRGVIWLPPHHDMGLVGGVLQPVFAGFPVLLLPAAVMVRNPLRWLEAVSAFRASTSGGPNFAYRMCVQGVRQRDLERLDLSCWKVAFCGAEPISRGTLSDFERRFAAAGFAPEALLPCYGMAETTLMVSGKPAAERWQSFEADSRALARGLVRELPAQADQRAQPLVSCGRVHASFDLRIVDPVLGIERAERELGEIWVSGASVSAGYWNDAAKTRQTFGHRLPRRDGSYLRTGDIGFVDRGQLFVTGRLKEVLIIRGANFNPQDIEEDAAVACPGLAGTRIAAFPVGGAGGEGIALAIEAPRSEFSIHDAVRRINARMIEKYGVRADLLLLVPRKTIRLTSSGKLQRLALREDYHAGRLQVLARWQEAADAPGAAATLAAFSAHSVEAVHDWIVARIAAIVQCDPASIGGDDSFAELALDSVSSLEMLAELDREHGIGIAPDTLYRHNTPQLLAREIHRLFQARSLPTGACHGTV